MPKQPGGEAAIRLTPQQIIQLFLEGRSIKELSKMIYDPKECTQQEAKATVERAIYDYYREGRWRE